MKMNRRSTLRAALLIALMLLITIASICLRADTGKCGGFQALHRKGADRQRS